MDMLNIKGKGSTKRMIYTVFVIAFVAQAGIAALAKCIIIAAFVFAVIAMQEVKMMLHPELPDEDDTEPAPLPLTVPAPTKAPEVKP
jgi:hypothetical protein